MSHEDTDSVKSSPYNNITLKVENKQVLMSVVQGDSSFTARTINPIKKLVKITKL
jgi:hypothetical protein